MSNSLIAKLRKNSTIKQADILHDSKFFEKVDRIVIPVPIMNLAMSGDLDGGLIPGVTMFAGPSKHGKSVLGLLCCKAYMDAKPNSAMLFYDSEFGSPRSYFDSFGIDTNRVLHNPLMNIEELKFDIIKQLDEMDEKDDLIIFIDSIGNVASKKEVEDAKNEKSTADMTRAKQLKSLFRMVTPYLRMKNIPMIVINHTYQSQDLFPKTIVGGGTGSYYSSENIFVMGRQQEKDGTELAGWNLVLNVEKSRYCVEKSKFTVQLTYGSGMNKWSGLLDIAESLGHVVKPSNGWFSRVINGEVEEQKWRRKDTNTPQFWTTMLQQEAFKEAVRKKYQVSNGQMLVDDLSDIDDDGEML